MTVSRLKGKRAGFIALCMGVSLGVLLWQAAFVTCYRDSYISIRKPLEPYREAADYLLQEQGIWDEGSLFYKNYAQLPREQLLSYGRIYCLRIHMDVDDDMKQLLSEYYDQVQTKDENGVEIWECKGQTAAVYDKDVEE